MASITACMVTYDQDPATIQRAVESLLEQGSPPDQVVICDNHPQADTAARFETTDLPVRVIAAGRNLGYSSGINRAAALAGGDYLLFCNPDAELGVGCLGYLLEAAESDPLIAICGAQILLPSGLVNAGDNPIHLTGLSWSGHYGESREHGSPRDVLAVSGAVKLVSRRAWQELGGFCEGFFLYHDDVDLAWRARLAGYRVVFCPEAVAAHDFDFHKGPAKWGWMERNRLWCVLTNYEARTLATLTPLLVVAEFGILAIALRGRWFGEKLHGYRDLVRSRSQLRRHRRRVRSLRKIQDDVLLREFAATITTPLFPVPGRRVVNALLLIYKRLALLVVTWSVRRPL